MGQINDLLGMLMDILNEIQLENIQYESICKPCADVKTNISVIYQQ